MVVVCTNGNTVQVDTVGKDSQWGTGGMVTKLTAARIATAAGCTMVICSSSEPELMPDIIRGKQAGTVFHPLPNAVRSVHASGNYATPLQPRIKMFPFLNALKELSPLHK